MIHIWAWLFWLLTVLATLATTRNPIYLAIIAIELCILWNAIPDKTKNNSALPLSPLRFAMFVIPFSMLYNAVISHYGEHVLLRIPSSIPLIGGAITLEALVYGLLNGVILSSMYAAFGLLNRTVETRDLLNIIPRAFYPLAVVITIAVTFIPLTIRYYHQVRDAQRIRGHRMRGIRDWLSLALPLLIGGLERAFSLAESMTARGFVYANGRVNNRVRLGLIGGLLGLIAGWMLRLIDWGHIVGTLFILISLAVLVLLLWYIGKGTKRTVYHKQPWRWLDWGIIAGACLTLTVVVLQPRQIGISLGYSPYPNLATPTANIVVLISLLPLLAPVLGLLYRDEWGEK